MNKLLLLTAVFALAFYLSDAVKYTDCGSQTGKFSKIEVSNCDESANACVLKRHSNATIGLDFNMIDGEEVGEVSTVVHGVILGVEMPFPLANPNACVDSGLTCPLKQGVDYEYRQTLPVLRSYPKVSVTVKWELKDVAANKTIICVFIPAKIE